ncbi:hypothetical protein SELMODRAFT_424391 [Selaginella moellendorffii]|uniref:Bulb-type lectin domain-containing protein n=1 Tax=Selaginella moellendorffii TaxID=88036 RepID=D8SPQ9_SELML|nr:hypothetical protein SELMODRAFT_424391 [Selaginella moellendorffii]
MGKAWIFMIMLVGFTRAILQMENWTDINRILSISGVPTIASDGRIYICTGKNLISYNEDMSLNWTASLRSGTCERHIPPIIDSAGRVYLAAQNNVQIVTPKPYSYSTKKYTISFLYNFTSHGIGSKPVTGLAASQTDAAIMFYVNSGVGGLYAVTIEGTPRWSLGGIVNSSDWQQSSFDFSDFCSSNSSVCYFHYSPAVDMCDGSLYIAHSNGWLYAISGWQPFIRWRYNFGLNREASEAGITTGNNGLVYAAVVAQEMVYAFDAQTGDVFWRVKVGPLSVLTCFPRVDLTGWVFIGSVDGCLYAISPNGQEVKKYLELESKSSIIQAPPYLECNGGALYVAQVQVTSKYISYGARTLVSYTDALSVFVSQIDPFTGTLYRRQNFLPDLSTKGGCTFDSSLILALVAASVSTSGPCKAGERATAATCVGNLAIPQLPDMTNKKFKEYYISIPSVFIGFILAVIFVFTWWSRKRKLVKHRAALEREAAHLRGKYLECPSKQIEDRLFEALSQLNFLDVLISDQAHSNASLHGLRRRLELSPFSPYTSGSNNLALYHPLEGDTSLVSPSNDQEVIPTDLTTIKKDKIASMVDATP